MVYIFSKWYRIFRAPKRAHTWWQWRHADSTKFVEKGPKPHFQGSQGWSTLPHIPQWSSMRLGPTVGNLPNSWVHSILPIALGQHPFGFLGNRKWAAEDNWPRLLGHSCPWLLECRTASEIAILVLENIWKREKTIWDWNMMKLWEKVLVLYSFCRELNFLSIDTN